MKNNNTLYQRQRMYEESYNSYIIPRIPIIIKVDGRNFAKLTANLQKPFDIDFHTIMIQAMRLCLNQIEGCIFAYQYSDKIFFILKNDQKSETDPWLGNRIQKMVSVISSIVTNAFIKSSSQSFNDATFVVNVFGVPDITEVINYLIYRQFICIQNAVNEVAHTILKEKHGNDFFSILDSKSIDERKKIIYDTGIIFEDYPLSFRHGVAAYITPKLIDLNEMKQVTKQIWYSNFDLPLFVDNKDFLRPIITTGSDIFRSRGSFH